MKNAVRSPSDLLKTLSDEILPLVSKPNRYVGNEIGLAGRDWETALVRMVLCYPDVYEVGMSHTGTQILYHIVNRDPRWLLDRVYAPWPDMEEQIRTWGLPLWGLEQRRPVAEYDVLGFTLQSELTYTNLLNVIDLSRIPLRQRDRRESDPLVCVGGPCASNPEPLAPFIDFALIGDAEDALPEVLEAIGQDGDGMADAGRLGILVEGQAFEVVDEGGGAIAIPEAAGTPGSGQSRRVRATVDGETYEFEVEVQTLD